MRGGPTRAHLRLAVLLTAVGVVAAAGGGWFNLPGSGTVTRWQADFTATQAARASRYHAELSLWPWWSLLSPIVTSALIAGVAPVRRALLRAAGRLPLVRGDGQVAAVAAMALLLAQMSTWPAELAMNSVDRRWRLTSQGPQDLLRELSLRLAIESLTTFLLVGLVLWLMRLWPHTWPARLALAAAAMVASLGLIPSIPGFPSERTQALPRNAATERIHELADKAGLGGVSLRVSVSGSSDETLNAYASGGGPWARVVVQRGSLTKSSEPELLSMLGHEFGHVKNRDPLTASVVGGAATGLLILTLGFALQRRGRLRGGAWVAARSAPGLVCLWLMLQCAGLPIQNAISRGVEARADAYTLSLTRDPAAFISMMRRVALTNVALIGNDAPRLWTRSHPTVVQRIAAARQWAADNRVAVPATTVKQAAKP